ncbi:PTS sugar transporter subunit IIA [Methylobacterium sp. Leaf93]|uniref:PTS sugar transporter subunit IIA n=1 Tax=Methylobacterium sp. Leaf93 TaxID=1736249 RepID=UPI0006F8036D|nr:PTS sugar transporter subunit IIA [Methylobacterium sp. Leaf93]KQP09174.1 PTS sugar transporter subunit IIA [Methylobacterium sp. Leaf93]
MTIDDILSPDQVAVGVRTASKAALLDDLARRAAQALGLDPGSLRTALEKREGLGSTGVGDGIALPHARLEGVRRPFGCLVRLRDAVNFDAIDERPVDLVFLLLLPNNAQGTQLNALTCVARRMRDPEAAAAMRGARDASALYATMRGSRTAP